MKQIQDNTVAMTPTISETLLDAALALPAEARAELAGILLNSLEPPVEPSISQAMAEESERRIDAIDCGEISSISREEFEAWRRKKWNR
jgi:putative addiction module component (TIGR02574 family)